jgi:hypothetical protein
MAYIWLFKWWRWLFMWWMAQCYQWIPLFKASTDDIIWSCPMFLQERSLFPR